MMNVHGARPVVRVRPLLLDVIHCVLVLNFFDAPRETDV
jgi:hypothetical protein